MAVSNQSAAKDAKAAAAKPEVDSEPAQEKKGFMKKVKAAAAKVPWGLLPIVAVMSLITVQVARKPQPLLESVGLSKPKPKPPPPPPSPPPSPLEQLIASIKKLFSS
mmetsp:Transcript_38741/g.99072  ORF Transcript_38741/g.99072 Transcript_38741/m.99072 type:complete len:107 (+) Transcript_38741:190-510(+)